MLHWTREFNPVVEQRSWPVQVVLRWEREGMKVSNDCRGKEDGRFFEGNRRKGKEGGWLLTLPNKSERERKRGERERESVSGRRERSVDEATNLVHRKEIPARVLAVGRDGRAEVQARDGVHERRLSLHHSVERRVQGSFCVRSS